MKTYTYHIYHIPGIKIGCTTELDKRMKDQGFINWEILWQQEGDYEFGWIAGDKEQELQKQYKLPSDKVHYQISRSLSSSVNSQLKTEQRSEMGKQYYSHAAKVAGSKLFECPECNRIIKSIGGLNSYRRTHKKS